MKPLDSDGSRHKTTLSTERTQLEINPVFMVKISMSHRELMFNQVFSYFATGDYLIFLENHGLWL